MSKPSYISNIEELIVARKAMTDELNDIVARSEELKRSLQENTSHTQKLMVSANIKEVIYDGCRYYISNGLQVEKHTGIVIHKITSDAS